MDNLCVDLQSITKSFQGDVVLKNIDLKLYTGHFYALLGQNGAGKSTLMKILMRTEVPDSGDGKIFGFDIADDLRQINQRVGYVAESIQYVIPLSIGQFGEIYTQFYPRWNQSTYDRFLSFLRLNPLKNYTELSRGQKMQVALAVSIATQPELLLLDEITSVLDAGARNFVMEELGQFVKQGGTVLMATNIVSEVHAYADHLLLIEDGQIHLNTPIVEVAKKFRLLKKPKGKDHPIFSTDNCVLVGTDVDQSLNYLIPIETSTQGLPTEWLDPRPVNLSEAFIYFTRKKGAQS